ncbi:MAG: anti-sigma factor antagonist [Calditrichaeota bacterium]|nr:STAS domain-containing protein [Calditrichota bacterium]RQW08137.1 MAG: anti-sigma factor antagonist [Calditrichota bacterium]
MEITVNRNGKSIRISIIGAVDNENAEELKYELQNLTGEDFQEAVFDLSYVPFITSSGIGKFLIFYKTLLSQDRKMRIEGINDTLLDLFKSIKLDQLFTIEK